MKIKIKQWVKKQLSKDFVPFQEWNKKAHKRANLLRLLVKEVYE